jgi:hypothetical protein
MGGISQRFRNLLFFLLLPLFSFGQSSNCSLIPEIGPCYASITKYYFDYTTQKCSPFIWGGCGGVVPFDNYNDCYVSCELSVGINDLKIKTDKKLIRVLNILGQVTEPQPNIILFCIYEDGTVERKIFIE